MEVTLVASADIYDAISESDETDNNYTYTENWTADDFGCESDSDCERTGVTGFRCSDNYDNDGDGLRDRLDRGCTAPWDDDERNACLDGTTMVMG